MLEQTGKTGGDDKIDRAHPSEALADRTDYRQAHGIDPATGERLPGESRKRRQLADIDTLPGKVLHGTGKQGRPQDLPGPGQEAGIDREVPEQRRDAGDRAGSADFLVDEGDIARRLRFRDLPK